MKISKEKRSELKRLYESGIKTPQLASMFGVTAVRVGQILREDGVELFRKLSPDQITDLIRRYSDGESAPNIGKSLGISSEGVVWHLKKNGIATKGVPRDYKINESCFDAQSEERDYWVGFLMADGCISDRSIRGYATHTIKLAIKEEDYSHIERFKKFVGSNKHKIGRDYKTMPSGNTYCTIIFKFNSKRIADKLSEFGVVPRKTSKEKVIGLENSRHFWRGLIDGDGCLTINSRGQPLIELVNGKDMLDQYKNYIATLNPNFSKKIITKRDCNDYILTCSCRPAYEIIKHLYSDCTIALDRKLAIANSVIALYETSDSEAHLEVA